MNSWIDRALKAVNLRLQLRNFNRCFPKSRGKAETCVIGNAIPKSGTYLLNSILRHLGAWQKTDIHFLDHRTFQFHEDKDTTSFILPAYKAIRVLQNGQMAAAHLHHTKLLAKVIDTNPKVRHIFQYRDPRDCFVSYARFMTYSSTAAHWSRPRKEQEFLKTFFKNDEDRLTYSIIEIMKREDWDSYLPWLTHRNTFCVRFEEVYSELLRLSDQGFGPTLSNLLKYLGFSADNLDPIEFQSAVLGSGKTASSEVNKIGQFKRHFTDFHYQLLDNPVFQKVLQDFGYEEQV